MKKLTPFLFLFVMLAAGCQTDPAGDSTKLELSQNEIETDCLGKGITIELTHSFAWQAELSPGADQWLSYELQGTLDGVSTFVLTLQDNDTEQKRFASLAFRSGSKSKVLSIVQEALLAEVGAESLDFGFLGESESVAFTTTVPEESLSIHSGALWCVVERDAENDLITVTAKPNGLESERTTTITIVASSITRTITVTQDPFDLEVSSSSLEFGGSGGTQSLTVTTAFPEWTWDVSSDTDWITVEKIGEGSLTVTAPQNSGVLRSAFITIRMGELSRTVSAVQYSATALADKQVVQMQSATVGSGVNIVIMGDGYVASDMEGGGKYEKDIYTAMEHFFDVYPYSHYRDYFNVWMIGAVSNESGTSYQYPLKEVDTVLGTWWAGPYSGSTEIGCDHEIVRRYSRAVANIAHAPLDEITTIITINDDIYAGTCYMGDDYGDGYSVSLCPAGSEFKKLVQHEAGGHGFGKLMDEYIYNFSQTIPNGDKRYMMMMKSRYGWYANVDFYSDIFDTTWAGFADIPDYSMVSTFEGSYMYGKGIWRPEDNSCMNDNVPYYNAPSRYAIIERIYEWAGEECSFERFLSEDIIPPYPKGARTRGDGVSAPVVPLTPPVIVPSWADFD